MKLCHMAFDPPWPIPLIENFSPQSNENRLENNRSLWYAKMKFRLNVLKQGLFLLSFVARPLCMHGKEGEHT